MIASPEPTVGLIAVVTILIGGDYMNVGIRELKAHLSDYVRRAERGEPILVTQRGKPVARLVGLGGVSAVDRGIAEGWITPPSGAGLEPIVRCKARRSTADALDEDRG